MAEPTDDANPPPRSPRARGRRPRRDAAAIGAGGGADGGAGSGAAAALDVQPLTPARWPDLEALFGAVGCSVARHCWCMYYRASGAKAVMPAGSGEAAHNRRALKALVDAGRPPGLIGYRDGTPVGWVALGPREDFAKLARSPVMKPVDERPAWSIVCFVVPSKFRRQGVARALLAGAVAWAKAQGATLVEGYPVDRAGRAGDDTMWFGAKSMFDRAGFTEVARRKPQRPVVRLRLG
jgi:GNAT superfamily N-acetyltransferase